ncbi:MAG: amino acid permease [Spirochaetia bacterium]
MKMKKNLTFIGVFSISAGAMISSGIFILPGVAFSRTGPAVILSYAMAGGFALVGILSVIELATAMPKAGGDYFFIHRSLGPMIGTVSGLVGWIALSLKSAFAIYGIAETLELVFSIEPYLTIIICCIVFVIMNCIGVEFENIFQSILVAALLFLLGVFIATGLPNVQLQRYTPFFAESIESVFITAGFIFISFGGLLQVASISEEVKDLKKTLPAAMGLSVLVITVFYVLIVFVITGVLPSEHFSGASTPVIDSSEFFLGAAGYWIVTIASLLAFVTTANAGILAASRYPVALGRDSLLPQFLAKISKNTNIPVRSVVLTGILIFISLLLPIETLVKAGSTVVLTSFVFTNAAVIIFREGRVSNYKPSFSAPFYPFLQIFSILLFSFFIIALGLESIEISLGLLFFALGVYFFYGRKNEDKEYALLHLVERITEADLTTGDLESELKVIVHKRDDAKKQVLDILVQEAEVMDIDGPLDLDEFFSLVSKQIENKVTLSADEIKDKLMETERECSTAVSNSFAIPHIILQDGEKEMLLVLVRSRNGIHFSEERKNVKIVFLFIGSIEDRQKYLKAIASIACLVKKSGFMDNWMEAEDPEALRELVMESSVH